MAQVRSFVKDYIGDNKEFPLTGPLMVGMHFKIPMGSVSSQEQREGLVHWKRPDGDNLEKFLMDALTGVLWKDDSQVAVVVRIKTWAKPKDGSTEVWVEKLPIKEKVSVRERFFFDATWREP